MAKHSTVTDAAQGSAPASAHKPGKPAYYASNGHDAAYRSVLDGMRRHESCIVLSGASGVGKTVLLRKLVKEASGPDSQIVYCPSAAIEFDQLVSFIGDKLELSVPNTDHQGQLTAFRNYLRACADANIGFTLILDDAQLLRDELLERLCTLSELSQCPVSVVLSAWPILLDRLTGWRRRFPFVANALLINLPRLSEAEAKTFIQHYWQAAKLSQECSDQAIERLVEQAEGLPGLIYGLCEKASQLARESDSPQITETLVEHASAQLPKNKPNITPLPVTAAPPTSAPGRRAPPTALPNRVTPPRSRLKSIMTGLASVALLVAGGWGFVKFGGSGEVSPSVAPALQVSMPKPVAPKTPMPESPSSEGPGSVAKMLSHPFDLNRHKDLVQSTPQTLPIPQASTESRIDKVVPATVKDDSATPITPLESTAAQSAARSEPLVPAASESALDDELVLWRRIKDSRNVSDYQDYLDQYPQGRFAKLVQLRQQRLGQQREDEINALLEKSQRAFNKNALTTPEQDNAVKWAQEALSIDPGNLEARSMLHAVLDTYIDWAASHLERQRFSSAASYLERARILEYYAKPEQLAALNVLNKQVISEQQRLARQQSKPRNRTQTARAGSSRSARTSGSTSYASWVQQLDQKMQSIGREIDLRMGTHGRTTVRQDDLTGFQNR